MSKKRFTRAVSSEYVFNGFVSEVDDEFVLLHMADQTVPWNPDEFWTVPLEKLPHRPYTGQRVTLTIGDNGGVFWLDDSRWTDAQIQRAHERAKEICRALGIPETSDAVDPVARVVTD